MTDRRSINPSASGQNIVNINTVILKYTNILPFFQSNGAGISQN